MKKDTFFEGCNKDKSVRKVQHRKLKKFDSSSIYRSDCPVCKCGVLAVQRDPRTMNILKRDYCFSCGQQFEYTDIEEGYQHLVYKRN